MIFSLDVRRARKGDCLLLHYGTESAPALVLIDGGPSNVYKPHLKPRLEKIQAGSGLGAGDPLPIDLMMVSHVDDDHIHGMLDFTRELRQAAGVPLGADLEPVAQQFRRGDRQHAVELTKAVTAQFGAASVSGGLTRRRDGRRRRG